MRDTGKGISPEFLPYVFDRFRQESNKSGGMGLGMAITKNLALLDINITLSSVEKVGRGQKKSLDEAQERLLSTEAEIARMEEELARLKGDTTADAPATAAAANRPDARAKPGI